MSITEDASRFSAGASAWLSMTDCGAHAGVCVNAVRGSPGGYNAGGMTEATGMVAPMPVRHDIADRNPLSCSIGARRGAFATRARIGATANFLVTEVADGSPTGSTT